ncbi:signal transduction histidine kinase [Rhodococcus coprophilus]|nr:signal transduction histidine kinase [Rhodococcus coprophilus]
MKKLPSSGMKATVQSGRRHWLTIGVVSVTLILYAVAWPTLHLTHDVTPPMMPLVSAAAVFPMLLVWNRPTLGWALAVATALVVPIAFDRVDGFAYPWQVVHIIVMLVLVAAVSIREQIRVVLVVWIATVLLFFAFVPGNDGWGWALGITAIVTFGLLVRWLVISRRQLARVEEVSELERARREILEEKAHIARELHDIVAHHMSLIVVQAQSAPYRLPEMSEPARAEFESIGTTAREALNDVRSLLGVLRSDGELPESAPQPGLDRIEELFDASLRAGVRLETTTTGSPSGVTDGVGLTMYRILQESLANSARHAPGADVTARIDWEVGTVTVSVTNGPGERGRSDSDPGGGNGIRGMAERATAVGGHLVAHPRHDGGFEVRAVLPTRPA